jgi:hypothetical protein
MFDRLRMLFMYYEISRVGSAVDRLKSVSVTQYGPTSEGYEGAPLASGDSIQFFLYPNLTNVRINPSSLRETQIGATKPFDNIGEYDVRVVYTIPPRLQNLYQGTWRSNAVRIQIRHADDTEREILRTLWRCLPQGESGIDWVIRDLEDLRELIRQHASHPLIAHVRYGLARAYYREGIAGHPSQNQQAIDLLRDLMKRSPEFRHEETNLFLGKALLEAGDKTAGSDILLSMMEREPVLWSNPDYVQAVTVVGIREYSTIKEWKEREARMGAKPMSRSAFLSGFWEQ